MYLGSVRTDINTMVFTASRKVCDRMTQIIGFDTTKYHCFHTYLQRYLFPVVKFHPNTFLFGEYLVLS